MNDHAETKAYLLRQHSLVSDRLTALVAKYSNGEGVISAAQWNYNLEMLNVIEKRLDQIMWQEYKETWPLRVVRRDE